MSEVRHQERDYSSRIERVVNRTTLGLGINGDKDDLRQFAAAVRGAGLDEGRAEGLLKAFFISPPLQADAFRELQDKLTNISSISDGKSQNRIGDILRKISEGTIDSREKAANQLVDLIKDLKGDRNSQSLIQTLAKSFSPKDYFNTYVNTDSRQITNSIASSLELVGANPEKIESAIKSLREEGNPDALRTLLKDHPLVLDQLPQNLKRAIEAKTQNVDILKVLNNLSQQEKQQIAGMRERIGKNLEDQRKYSEKQVETNVANELKNKVNSFLTANDLKPIQSNLSTERAIFEALADQLQGLNKSSPLYKKLQGVEESNVNTSNGVIARSMRVFIDEMVNTQNYENIPDDYLNQAARDDLVTTLASNAGALDAFSKAIESHNPDQTTTTTEQPQQPTLPEAQKTAKDTLEKLGLTEQDLTAMGIQPDKYAKIVEQIEQIKDGKRVIGKAPNLKGYGRDTTEYSSDKVATTEETRKVLYHLIKKKLNAKGYVVTDTIPSPEDFDTAIKDFKRTLKWDTNGQQAGLFGSRTFKMLPSQRQQ